MRDVQVDRGTEHMLGWGQRIATRTGVESPSGSWKKDDDLLQNNKKKLWVNVRGELLLVVTHLSTPLPQRASEDEGLLVVTHFILSGKKIQY